MGCKLVYTPWIALGFMSSLTLVGAQPQRQCFVPFEYQGTYFSMERGEDVHTIINNRTSQSTFFNGTCVEYLTLNSSQLGGEMQILYYSRQAECYKCFHYYLRTLNIVQYKQSVCRSFTPGTFVSMDEVCSVIVTDTEIDTYFRRSEDNVNCKNTFEGIYAFTYELDEGWGMPCTSPDSFIVACQEPGSPYVDNQVFYIEYGACPDVSFTKKWKGRSRFQCLGSWEDHLGNIWSGVADLDEEVPRDRYRCMLTRIDQEPQAENAFLFSMTFWADCKELVTYDYGHIKTEAWPEVKGYQEGYLRAGCRFPANYTGTWFYQTENSIDVEITSDRIHMTTRINNFYYQEKYMVCRMNRDSRFLVRIVTVGKCEVDYVCLDMLPRQHSILRWRMGKPYRLTVDEEGVPDFEFRMFARACAWDSFTIDRRNAANWKYQTFVLNPPAPVICPIRGRYSFVQQGHPTDLYTTRIRGVTERPRHMIDCHHYVSEIKSCSNDPFTLSIDAEYCETVDHTGRPIGEYDMADWELTCVGYWMEDMQLYMITWDKEDGVSPYRCWNYERTDFRHIKMSRSNTMRCPPTMRSDTWGPETGASLALELTDSERLFDDCPQSYADLRTLLGRTSYLPTSSDEVNISSSLTVMTVALILSIII